MVESLAASTINRRPGEVFNLASGIETSIKNLAKLINELTLNTTPVDLRPVRKLSRSGKRYGDPTKMRVESEFALEVALPEGLKRTIAWTRANMDTIERCISQHRLFTRKPKTAVE